MTHKETHKARTRSPIMTCCESLTHGVISQETSRLRSWQSLGRILSHTGEAIIWQKSLKRRHAGNLALFSGSWFESITMINQLPHSC